MSAAWYAQYKLNNGVPVGFAIPATEHSIMTGHKTEKAAITQLLNEFGSGVCACVMDSYDYTAALEKILPSVAALKVQKGGFLVLRPDSGNPVEVVLQALRAADSIFGSDVNKKGFKVLRGVGVIQGDGINPTALAESADAVKKAGFSAQNCAYGMGAGLLQKVNRDTMSFATKLSKIVYADKVERDVMKMPKTESGKFSLPGEFKVVLNDKHLPVVYPAEEAPQGSVNELVVVYDHGKVIQWDSFSAVSAKAKEQWPKSPLTFDVISPQLKAKIERVKAAQAKANIESVQA